MKVKLTEVAQCLDLPINTIERWVRQGRIPIRKTGALCIFKTAVLEQWARKHNIKFTHPIEENTSEYQEKINKDNKDTLLRALKRGGVHHIESESIENLLKTASKKISGLSLDEQTILYERLIEREKLTSTGIGKGIAIPHPRTPMQCEKRPPVIATFFLKKGLDFKALDDLPVTVIFVIVCPSVQTHLNLLSMISFCLRNDSFVEFLNTFPDPEVFFQRINELEKSLEKSR